MAERFDGESLFDIESPSVTDVLARLDLHPGALAGQVVVLTGGARGIGSETALGLGHLGATVVIVDKRESGDAVARAIAQAGGAAEFIPVNLSDSAGWQGALGAVLERYGRVDVLINDAVEFGIQSVSDMRLEDWDYTHETNLRACFIAIKAVLPGMRARGRGVIANLIGPAGLAYAADMSSSKAGLRSLMVSLAAELGTDSGLSVYGFAPGLVATPLVYEVFPHYTARLGLTFREYVEQVRPNPGYGAGLMPPSHCGASLVHTVVHAAEHHGTIVDSFPCLARAGLIELEEERAGDLVEDPVSGALDNIDRLQSHMVDIYTRRQVVNRLNRQTALELQRQLSEREAIERALAESEARLENLTLANVDAIVTMGADGTISSWNPAAEKMFGYPSGEALGKALSSMLPELDLSAKGQVSEMSARRWSGEAFPVQLSLTAWRNEGGEHFGAIVRDVTERTEREVRERELFVAKALAEAEREKALALERALAELRETHEQLAGAQEQLQQSTKMAAMGQMAGGIAHDFNNMLTAILNFTRFAMEDLGEEHPVLGDLQEVLDAGEKTQELAAQLLAFSRKTPVNPRVFDLNVIITQMRPMVARILGADVHVAIELGVEPSETRIDRSQIEQVLVNLCLNAREAMPRGGKLWLSTRSLDEQIILEVRDDGRGMDRQTLERCFEPFFSTKPKGGKGTGMGLAMAYGIISQAGGQIGVESQPGLGTAFMVSLPRTRGVHDAVVAAPELEPPAGRGECVLLVEDQPEVRRAVTRILERSGYTVRSASCADEATAMDLREVDLLLTDVVMPGISGPELARILRESYPSMPVVFMSGYAKGATAYDMDARAPMLQKPFSDRVLLRTIRDVLGGASRPVLQ